ncbi:hypothetical protein WK01_36100 [Burkholderia cepacia]|nr:hypothetical protein WK01_36100 [Burkholderia cepacia]
MVLHLVWPVFITLTRLCSNGLANALKMLDEFVKKIERINNIFSCDRVPLNLASTFMNHQVPLMDNLISTHCYMCELILDWLHIADTIQGL